ncbi:hypothetical protein ACE3MS_15350 [Paenibacillus dendritiformis]|uniref:hypothetical protein n=1 Tax=Paenibacillus dendritiformis TaxID=130049 RepID=UPI003650D255
MNVYFINGYWIAAPDADKAFGEYMEETNAMDDMYISDLREGESEEIIIQIRRLKKAETVAKTMECHGEFDVYECKFCTGKNDTVYISLQDIIDNTDKDAFPCVIAKEE